ncbi:MAG: hypothetical protein EU541_02080 [Promethearchaeota archaeon]|nr:MAG: hypothetical protein EU541_02080 [Candidatus Lokiarchaeota archaeon]
MYSEITDFFNSDYKDQQEVKKKSNKKYDDLKTHKNKIYTGMKVGGKHYWNYDNGKWYEIKKSPNLWKFTFSCVKNRHNHAPLHSGARVGTKYHWYIIADQIAEKLDANSYNTLMKGVKFKVGHKRPNWKNFSYQYPEQKGYKERLIEILEDVLARLKSE